MSVQYAGGTNVNTTFANTSSPTRREVVDGIVAALTTAGWSTVSGGGTGDVLMESATTSQSLKIRVQVKDPGSGSTARLYLKSGISSAAGTFGCGLLPEASKTWRVIANRYQAFIFVPGSTKARDFVAFGNLHIPVTFSAQILECGWMWGSANSDSDTTTRPHFRTTLGANINFSTAEMCFILNGNMFETGNGTNYNSSTAFGLPTMVYPQQTNISLGNVAYAYRWHDDSSLIFEPLLAFGCNINDEAKIRGQLYDAIVITEPMNGGTELVFDSHNFYSITHNNVGYANGSSRGTLLVVIP